MALTSYTHTQSTPSTTWNIRHNLGAYPIVDVLIHINGVLTKIIPNDIVMVDMNNVNILFTQPYTGQARVF